MLLGPDSWLIGHDSGRPADSRAALPFFATNETGESHEEIGVENRGLSQAISECDDPRIVGDERLPA
jgi:hypothetical protein